ncbi:MAG: hypothetical protein BMS9Abin10_0722 [Gammaproteobacteria bacterium]|nr:MAG: hypothetical protein BMS9Abin10_0722 [Gammaproteobacteria bacterium]
MLFGSSSRAALATVVGMLVEVPVMLLVVKLINRSKPWYERGAAVPASTRTERTDAKLGDAQKHQTI